MDSDKRQKRILTLFDDSDSEKDCSESFTETSESECSESDGKPCDTNEQFSRNAKLCSPDTFSSKDVGSSTSPDSENNSNVNIQNRDETVNEIDGTSELWYEDTKEIMDFNFDSSSTGVTDEIKICTTPREIFVQIWSTEIMDLIVRCTNKCGNELMILKRPCTKNCRIQSFKETNIDEIGTFFGLCLLQSQIKIPQIRSNWSNNPLYYHPIFSASMTERRFEQLLCCLNCELEPTNDGISKISGLLRLVNSSFQNAYKPGKNLSLDEPMMLHRGKLSFRQFMRSMKTKYGIKFYELCTHDGYVLNLEIYRGKMTHESLALSELNSLVTRLLAPYLLKGHSLFMDSYYNSVELSTQLLSLRTHTTGTLHINRKENSEISMQMKAKKGEHIWKRQKNVYVTKWKEKEDVLCITTEYHPEMIEIQNKYGIAEKKPIEIVNYNANMSAIDRCNRISYYSSPKKSIRWYKKVLFYLLDISVWNSYYIYNKISDANTGFLDFRDNLINSLLNIPEHSNGRDFVSQNANSQTHIKYMPTTTTFQDAHYQEKIPAPPNYKRKTYFLKCKYCYRQKIIKFTSYRCRDCDNKPPLCPGQCFQQWHTPVANYNYDNPDTKSQ